MALGVGVTDRNQEVNNASQIGSATKGRRCCALRQARQDECEQAQGLVHGMYKSMSEKQLDEFASTKRKGKPGSCEAAKSRPSMRKSPARKSGSRKKSGIAYCSRTSTLSAAPAASVTVRRTKPGPSGAKNSVRSSLLGLERHAVQHHRQGGCAARDFNGKPVGRFAVVGG